MMNSQMVQRLRNERRSRQAASEAPEPAPAERAVGWGELHEAVLQVLSGGIPQDMSLSVLRSSVLEALGREGATFSDEDLTQVHKVVEFRNSELALRIVDPDTEALKADAAAVRVLVARLLSDIDLESITVGDVQQLLADQLGVSCSDMLGTWAVHIDRIIKEEMLRIREWPWRQYLFDPAPRDDARCIGRCKVNSKEVPYGFRQCYARAQPGSDVCGRHARRPYGTWDPERQHESCPKVALEAARRQAIAHARKVLGDEADIGPRQDADRAVPRPFTEKQRKDHPQPPYVPTVPGELREWKKAPIPLPPFPCRLCDKNFATSELLEKHKDAEHCGGREYRKRLFFLEFSSDL